MRKLITGTLALLTFALGGCAELSEVSGRSHGLAYDDDPSIELVQGSPGYDPPGWYDGDAGCSARLRYDHEYAPDSVERPELTVLPTYRGGAGEPARFERGAHE